MGLLLWLCGIGIRTCLWLEKIPRFIREWLSRLISQDPVRNDEAIDWRILYNDAHKRHTKELEEIGRDKDEMRRERDQEKKKSDELRREKDEAGKKVDESRREIGKLGRETDKLRGERDRAQKASEEIRGHWDAALKNFEQMATTRDETIRDVRGQLEAQKRKYIEVVRERDALRDRYDKQGALLESRTSEVKVARTYLTKADSLSGAEIIHIVQDLNTDILQTAATIEDCFELGEVRVGQVEKAKVLAEELGHDIVQLLAISDDSTFLQIATQSILGLIAGWISKAWWPQTISTAAEVNGIYEAVYHEIYARELQPISGRWRSLARQNIERRFYRDTDLRPYLLTLLEDEVVKLLLVAPCKTGASPENIKRIVKDNVGGRLESIVNLSLQLNRIFGQETISADFECLWMRGNGEFDPNWMEDMDGDTSDPSKEPWILCSTGLGLRRREKLEDSGGAIVREQILLKAKVALPSLIGDRHANPSGAPLEAPLEKQIESGGV